MATEQASSVTTGTGTLVTWATWLVALVGLWVVASPFVLSGPLASGTALYSNAIAGVVILGLAAYGAYDLHRDVEPHRLAKWSGWLAGLAGAWIAVSPFVLAGSIAGGTAMWSNVAAGAVAFVLAAYAGYEHGTGG